MEPEKSHLSYRAFCESAANWAGLSTAQDRKTIATITSQPARWTVHSRRWNGRSRSNSSTPRHDIRDTRLQPGVAHVMSFQGTSSPGSRHMPLSCAPRKCRRRTRDPGTNASVAHSVGHGTMGGPMNSPAETYESSMVPAFFVPLAARVEKVA